MFIVVPKDFYAKIIMQFTIVGHFKSLWKLNFNSFEKKKIIRYKNRVIHIEPKENNFFVVMLDVNILINLTLNKYNLENICGESFIPFVGSLFEPINGLQKVTHFVFFTKFLISRWLNDIYFFSENAIEEGNFNIYLMDLKVICGNKSYYETQWSNFHDKWKSIFIINVVMLKNSMSH